MTLNTLELMKSRGYATDYIGTTINGSSKLQTSGSANHDFASLIKGVAQDVSDAEHKANELNAALQRGEDIPIHQVSLAMQKATLAFQTMNVARSKIVQAYQSIINMNI